MYSRSVALASLLLVPLAFVSTRSTPRSDQATARVEINAKCAGPNNTAVTVSPWNLTIAQDDDVEWVLDGNADTEEVSITPKQRGKWPYASQPPYKGGKANPARADKMKRNAKGRYSYNVTLVCTNGNTADTVTVDPDIIID